MNDSHQALTDHLNLRLAQVVRGLGGELATQGAAELRFADLLDSMAMVEYVAILADDFEVAPEAIELAVQRNYTTVFELARCLDLAGIGSRINQVGSAGGALGDDLAATKQRAVAEETKPLPMGEPLPPAASGCWLAATEARLPATLQSGDEINRAIGRPAGWLEKHAGNRGRRIWGGEDPLAAAAEAGMACLQRAGIPIDDIGALLVTSEAPPLLTGLAAALHHRLNLRSDAVALEVGGACTGYLACLWTARKIVRSVGAVLVMALEAPSRYLELTPDAAGEAAALFGDGVAASLICNRRLSQGCVPLCEIEVRANGSAGRLLTVERIPDHRLRLRMDGVALAERAIRTMADAVRRIADRHGVAIAQVNAVVAHGGNGRMPGLLARELGLPVDRVWSETSLTGNLGSASLPVAWAKRQGTVAGPIAWSAVGAGLTWGAALSGVEDSPG
jgi:3-oxoacyl-[acyl-carrier-protein] synthase-3